MTGTDKYILFYSPQTLPSVGGLQYVVHYWAMALSQQGYRVVVVSQTEGASQHTDGYTVLERPGYTLLRSYIRRALRVLMFDVALKALPAWLFTGTPLYISHQSGLWYPHQKVPLRQQLKRWVANHMASGQLACSTFIAGYYRHCKVVYNPFRHDVFFASPDTPKAPVLLFAGRLVTVKGADLLLEAFALLQQHAVAAPLELHIAGHGPALMELQQQARELGIAHKVKWLGMLTQTRLAQVMRTARCMVVPSRLEPMGMVAVEGMASGLTMVLSRQGGLPEVGGAFCHYFEPHRPVDLCRALLNALTQGTLGSPLALAQHLQQFTVAHSVCGLQSALMLSAGTLPE